METKISNLSENEIIKVLNNSKSFREVLSKFGYSSNGTGAYSTLKSHLKKLEIKIPEYNYYGDGKNKKRIPLSEILIENSLYQNRACLKNRLIYFRTLFLETQHLARSEKHISNPIQKSSAKRLCMYLRWMVRQDKKGVDFGIWKSISSQDLCLPLDVHTGNVSRILGLLKRKQNDWQAVEEITGILKSFDTKDPIKYDFALFGLGIDGALKESSKLKL